MRYSAEPLNKATKELRRARVSACPCLFAYKALGQRALNRAKSGAETLRGKVLCAAKYSALQLRPSLNTGTLALAINMPNHARKKHCARNRALF